MVMADSYYPTYTISGDQRSFIEEITRKNITEGKLMEYRDLVNDLFDDSPPLRKVLLSHLEDIETKIYLTKYYNDQKRKFSAMFNRNFHPLSMHSDDVYPRDFQ